jgi:hypothetical protein
MERLRRRSLESRFAYRKQIWKRVLLYVFCGLTYPFVIGFAALGCMRWLRMTTPKAGFFEWMRMYSLAISRNVPPVEYVSYGFQDAKRRALAPEYLYGMDGRALQELNALRGADNRDVQDKARFASLCVKHGLAHVPSLGVFRHGEVDPDAGVLAGEELWIKPLSLSASQGAELWVRHEQGYQASGGRILVKEALYAELTQGDFLVQRRLKNHKALAEMFEELPDDRAVMLRVVTGLGRDGEVELLGNYLMLPTAPGLTTAGGTMISLDWNDGRMRQRLDWPGPAKEMTEDEKIMPFFAEAVDLCKRAHATAFETFVTLGWDVVFTSEGPLLLETNSGWGSMEIQQLWGPLGLTALSSLVEQEWDEQPKAIG